MNLLRKTNVWKNLFNNFRAAGLSLMEARAAADLEMLLYRARGATTLEELREVLVEHLENSRPHLPRNRVRSSMGS